MTTGSYRRAGLWSLLGLGALAVAAAAVAPLVPGAAGPETRGLPAAGGPLEPYHADSLKQVVIAHDLFRLDRKPAPLAFDPERGLVPPPGPVGPPKPILRLVGLVEGARPQALIEGLPGVESGRALTRDESVAGLRVAEISRGYVRVVGMDTVWVLTLRRP